VVFTIPTSVTFGSGEASVSRAGEEALRTLARRLRAEFTGDARFHVEGHTDSDPIRSSGFKSNRDLSIKRSMAVVDFLVKECKISDERFVVAGYGPHRPLVSNEGAANKARNRRVELVVRQDQ
jgi:chemotaxis protein MotB